MAFAYVVTLDVFSNIPMDVFNSSGDYSKIDVEQTGIPFRMVSDVNSTAYQGLYLGDSADCLRPLECFSSALCNIIEYRQESGDWLRVS